MKAYKYVLVIPMLVLFVFNFNTEVVAQTKEPQSQKTKTAQNVLKYVISKDTKDKQLKMIKEKMAEQNVTIAYENLKRNSTKEITEILIKYESKKGSGEFNVNSNNPIKDIAITLNVNENTLTVGQATKNLSQSFEIVKEDGETTLKKEKKDSSVFVYSTDDDASEETVTVKGKDGENHEVKKEKNVYVIKSTSVKKNSEANDVVLVKNNKKDTVWIKQDVKNIVWTDDDGNVMQINASENGNKAYHFDTNSDKEPLIIVDGKKISPDELAKIKPNNIESMNVLKSVEATKDYGEEGKDGVIIVTTKRDSAFDEKKTQAEVKKELWAVGEVNNVTFIDDSGKKSSSTYFISKITGDRQLESYKDSLKKESVDVEFLKIKRNKNREITRIEIVLKDKQGKQTKSNYENDNGIGKISFGIQNGELFVLSEK